MASQSAQHFNRTLLDPSALTQNLLIFHNTQSILYCILATTTITKTVDKSQQRNKNNNDG